MMHSESFDEGHLNLNLNLAFSSHHSRISSPMTTSNGDDPTTTATTTITTDYSNSIIPMKETVAVTNLVGELVDQAEGTILDLQENPELS
jgi:hypothetical protein